MSTKTYLSGFSGLLRRIADRLDPAGCPRSIGSSFTFELGEGIRWRDDGKGCPLWYLGEDDYARAHDEADNPGPKIDWRTMTATWRVVEENTDG